MLHGDELQANLAAGWKGEDRTIFPVTMNDLFAESVPTWVIKAILERCCKWPQFTYLFQTKIPKRYLAHQFRWPVKLIRGTTIESNWVYDCMGETPTPRDRAIAMANVTGEKFVTIEPILKFDPLTMVQLIEIANPNYVYIGADSKKSGLPEPNATEIEALIQDIQSLGIEIRRKSNLDRLL
jgi:protein gp37